MIRDSKDHIQELVGKGFLTYRVGQQQHAFTVLSFTVHEHPDFCSSLF